MKKFLAIIWMVLLMPWQSHGSINWGAPTTISTAGVNASDPNVIIDANGNVTAAWIENAVIKTSSIPAGGSWGAIASLSNVSNASSNPLLGIDGKGNVTAVWIENGIVNTAALPFGGSWSASKALSNSSGGASEPTLCVDSSGNVAVAWARSGYIEAIQYSVTLSAWSSVNRISTNGADDNPNIYIGTSGAIVAVWHSVVSGADLVYSASGTMNANWGAPIAIVPSAQTNAHHNYPKVIVDSSGNAYAIWYSNMLSGTTYYNVVVLASTLSSSASAWTFLSTLSGAGLYPPAYLSSRLVIDQDDNALAFWTNSYDGATFTIESGTLPDRGAWQSPNQIVLNNIYSYQLDVSSTTVGTCIANFMYYDGANLDIQTAEASINGVLFNTWSIPVTISQGARNEGPRISAQSSNNTVYGSAIWINYNGTNNVIVASVGSGSGVLPPTNVQVVQGSNNLGLFTEYYNTITWNASTDPSVIQYILYRNRVAIQTVTPGTTQFVDHNAFQNQAVTYGVAAVGNAHILSQVVTASLP